MAEQFDFYVSREAHLVVSAAPFFCSFSRLSDWLLPFLDTLISVAIPLHVVVLRRCCTGPFSLIGSKAKLFFYSCGLKSRREAGLGNKQSFLQLLTYTLYSRQPWSAYAVHLTTLSPPALLGDLLLVWLCHKATGSWGESLHDQSMTALYFWIFTSKWIKLLGHYIRYPVDILMLPISILFGYFHGAIKMYAVMTLNVVCIPHFQVFLCFLSL